ncbi:alkylmercury lyase [Amycolatopsis alkalitolerans]|uniref:Alkylmercury lyase n=1 Tax=Amycolatopsis alkalitolerans TaxID=2547244 RepID=A0A5C4LXR1_9PSEU|nr:alkylmercury lyase [Amycolatopsis alkalitolerans]
MWHVPDCPLLDQVREALGECLRHSGLDIAVREREGGYPSPTLVIDGVDVATGAPPVPGVYCRLDLPTHEQIHAALNGEDRRGMTLA